MVRYSQLLLVALSGLASALQPDLVARDPPTCVTNPIKTTPKGLICDVQGAVTSASPIATTSPGSVNACRDACLNDQPGCVSFSYGTGDTCIFYAKRIIDQMFKRKPTGVTFWNHKCFKTVCRCHGGLKKCSNDCVDETSDPNNCGSCGNACGNGASCTNSACTCPNGQTLCNGPNGPCQDTTSDPDNCGSCGNTCGLGASCTDSACTCPSGQGLCLGPNGPCQDTSSDPLNCGSCGNVCGLGASCSNGACTCPSGQGLCSGPNGPCQDTTSDPNNCGSCGNTCGNGASCSSGACTCPFGQSLCNGPNGPCSDTYSDPNNCGSCGNICPGGTCYHGYCPECSGDFCSQGPGTPCGTAGNCNCVGIDGSQQYGMCVDINDGTSCEAFSPRCNTSADCPADKFCGNYQVACNCQRNACFPTNDRCANPANVLIKAAPKRPQVKGGKTAKGA